MHELAVTQSILSITQMHARQANASKVTDIYLVIGKLSSIIDDSVQFYWDIVSQGTICAGAALHFERIPARLACRQCGQVYTLEGDLTPCPACGGSSIEVISGDEFHVGSIEINREELPSVDNDTNASPSALSDVLNDTRESP